MEVAIIVLFVMGIGLFCAGLFYEKPKKQTKAPDYVVMADDGDDE